MRAALILIFAMAHNATASSLANRFMQTCRTWLGESLTVEPKAEPYDLRSPRVYEGATGDIASSLSPDVSFNNPVKLRKYPLENGLRFGLWPEQPDFASFNNYLAKRLVKILWVQRDPNGGIRVMLELVGRLWDYDIPSGAGHKMTDILFGRSIRDPLSNSQNVIMLPGARAEKRGADILLPDTNQTFHVFALQERYSIYDFSAVNVRVTGGIIATPIVPHEARTFTLNQAYKKQVRVSKYRISNAAESATAPVIAKIKLESAQEGTLESWRESYADSEKQRFPLQIKIKSSDGQTHLIKDSTDEALSVEIIN